MTNAYPPKKPPKGAVQLPLDLEMARIFETGSSLSNPAAHQRAKELMDEITAIMEDLSLPSTTTNDVEELDDLNVLLDRAVAVRNEAAYGPAILRIPEMRAQLVTLNSRIQGLRRGIALLEKAKILAERSA